MHDQDTDGKEKYTLQKDRNICGIWAATINLNLLVSVYIVQSQTFKGTAGNAIYFARCVCDMVSCTLCGLIQYGGVSKCDG